MPSFSLKDFKPHIYAISADVFRKLFEYWNDQAIIISGDSGVWKKNMIKKWEAGLERRQEVLKKEKGEKRGWKKEEEVRNRVGNKDGGGRRNEEGIGKRREGEWEIDEVKGKN